MNFIAQIRGEVTIFSSVLYGNSTVTQGVLVVAGFCTYLRDDGDLEPQVMEPYLCNINPINNNFTFSCFINPKQTQSKWGFSSSCSSNYSNLLGRNTRTTYWVKAFPSISTWNQHIFWRLWRFWDYLHTKSTQFHTVCFTSQQDRSLDQFFSFLKINIKDCCFDWLIHFLPSAHSYHLR